MTLIRETKMSPTTKKMEDAELQEFLDKKYGSECDPEYHFHTFECPEPDFSGSKIGER